MSLELRDVHVARGGNPVLHGINIKVADDQLLVVLGPSGAGKSTMLRVIAGLDPLTQGRILIAGRDVTGLRPGLRNVSMVFQSYALFPHLTVARNIAFGLIVRDVGNRDEKVLAAAKAAGCDHLLSRMPGKLSGGERQRVALARALVREPDIFLLDEPLSNLDAELRVETRAELKALHSRVGGTMVHVTHDQAEALVLGDQIAVMRDGRLEQLGTPDEIWHSPATAFVARFVGAMNILPDGRGFRPESVRIGDPDGNECPVERVEVIGGDAFIYMRLSGHLICARLRPAVLRPAVGDRLRMSVHPAHLHHFDPVTGLRL